MAPVPFYREPSGSHKRYSMRWLKPNLNSIYSLLGKPPPAAAPAEAFRIEAVRQLMLDTVMALDLDKLHPEVVRKISYALDIQGLWFARSDLMTAIASERGETFAREKLVGITELFDGLLPKAFSYQPSKTATRVTDANPPFRGKPKRR